MSCRQKFQSLLRKQPTGFPSSMCISYCWVGKKRDIEYLRVGDVSCHSWSLLEPLFTFGQSHPWLWSMAPANFNPSPAPAWIFDIGIFLFSFLFSFSQMLVSIPTNFFYRLIRFHHLMSLDLEVSLAYLLILYHIWMICPILCRHFQFTLCTDIPVHDAIHL